MKLQEGARGRRGSKAVEILTTEQPTVQFDLLRDVPPEVWDRHSAQVAAFTQGQHIEISRIIPPAQLAELRPDSARLLKEDLQVEMRVKEWAKAVWPFVLGSKGTGLNQPRLAEVVEFLNVFPELRSELPRPTNDQFRLILKRAVKPSADLRDPKFKFREGVPYFMNLLRAFPERQTEVRAVLDNSDFKAQFEQGLVEILGNKQEFVIIKFTALAKACVLYPSEANRFKVLAKPFWPTVKRFIQAKPDGAEGIWAAVVLSADNAQINQSGNLELEQHSKSKLVQALPDRFMV